MTNKIPSFLLARSFPCPIERGRGTVKVPFLERGIEHLARLIREGYFRLEFSSHNGLFRKMDARVKVLFLLFFILIVSLKRDLLSEASLSLFFFLLILLSRLNILRIYKRVFLGGFLFGFLIAFPSAFNFLTKGEIVLPLVTLSRPYTFWVYHVPADIGVTREGIYGTAMLAMRVMNSLSVSLLVLYTTPFHEIIRAFKILRVPDAFLIIITLCYKYIFILSKTLEDMYLAKKSRIAREVSDAEAREWIAGRIAFIFRKTRLRCEEVFQAMIGRGFSETVAFGGFGKMRPVDWGAAIFLFFSGLIFLFL